MDNVIPISRTQPMAAALPSTKVGERLVHLNFISTDQLQIALHEQKRTNQLLGVILVRLGFLDDAQLASVLATRTGFESINLKNVPLDPELMGMVPQGVAQRCRAIPLVLGDGALEIAMADPYDVVAMDEIRRYFPRGIDIIPRVASGVDIAEVLERYSTLTMSLDGIVQEMQGENATHIVVQKDGVQHPIIRLVDAIIHDAVRQRASDIHVEPEAHFIRIRYRIDGVLHQVRAMHRDFWPELSHRLKIMAGMNIADTRSVQDGRFSLKIAGADIDFRMAIMPVVYGENIVIRILDHRAVRNSLSDLGFSTATLQQLTHVLARPEGMILVTGPTGSGKTTTLYGMLNSISDTTINVMTLEEPIEYRFNLIRQTAVQEKFGVGFADGVRGILRQDPDVILIGEIRDHDTAHMALRAAMTGHQVFSTLHCNDAITAMARLIDLGLTPHQLLGNVAGVIGQRLVRRLCTECSTWRDMFPDEVKTISHITQNTEVQGAYGFAEAQAAFGAMHEMRPRIGQAVGCSHCRGTGYFGRVAVAEVMRMTPHIDDMFARGASPYSIFSALRHDGYVSMAEDAVAKIMAGVTTLEEVRRHVRLDAASLRQDEVS